jgi:predicted transcriptional regulator
LILIRIHKGGWVFNGNVAEFSIDKYKNDDLSISEIARKLGKNWRTVKKYADEEVYPSDTGQFVQKQE